MDSDSDLSTRTDANFKATLNQFAFSSPETPLRASLRLRAKTTVTVPATPKRKPEFSDSDEEHTPTKKKKPKKPKRGYASPEKYAHLSPLTDHLGPDLDILFCGINPGCMSASTGHHFASPTNHFWRALHLGGLTPKLIPPSDDGTLPQLYSLGLASSSDSHRTYYTNLVDRVSAEEAELSKDEMSQSVPALLEKIVQYKPRVLCFVGKGIWDKVEADFKKRIRQHVKVFDSSISRVKTSRIKSEVKAEEDVLTTTIDISLPVTNGKKKELQTFSYGPQPYKFMFEKESESSTKKETLIFVMPSTSGRVVSHQLVDKIKLFSQLREMVGDIKRGKLDSSSMEVIPIDDIRLKNS